MPKYFLKEGLDVGCLAFFHRQGEQYWVDQDDFYHFEIQKYYSLA